MRQRFKAWVENSGKEHNETSRYRFCILIDEEVLETLNRFPSSPIGRPYEKWQLYSVKVIDVEIDGEEDLDEYPQHHQCCIMTPPWRLAHLYFWSHNLDAEEMRNDDQGIPIYGWADE